MSFRVGDLIATISLDDRLTKGLMKAGDGLQKFGRDTAMISGTVAAIGGAAVVSAMQFDKTMTKMVSLAGVLPEDLQKVRDHLLALGADARKGPQELAEAMMVVSSVTNDTATALTILDVAARGSSVGMGETKDVARALTSVINSYGAENITAAQAGDILTQTIKDGGAEADQLAGVLANVIPAASQMGIEFEQVGAFLATVTKNGTPAAEAVTQLSAVMTALSKETKEGEAALLLAGTSYENLRKAAGENLQAALQGVTDKLGGNVVALHDVFGREEAFRGVMSSTGAQAKIYAAEVAAMTGSIGALDKAHKIYEASAGAVWDKFVAQVKIAGLELGTQLVPALVNTLTAMKPVMDALIGMVKWFADAPAPIRVMVLGFGLFVAAMAPVAFVVGSTISTFGTLLGVVLKIGPALFALGNTVPILTARLWALNAVGVTIATGFMATAAAVAAVGIAAALLVKTLADESKASSNLREQEELAALGNENAARRLVANQKAGEALIDTQKRLADEKRKEIALAATIAPLTDKEIVAKIRQTKAQETLAKALELTGKVYTNVGMAEHVLKLHAAEEKATKITEEFSDGTKELAKSLSGGDISAKLAQMAAAMAMVTKSGKTLAKPAVEEIRTLVSEARIAGVKIPEALINAAVIPLERVKNEYAKLAQTVPAHLAVISAKAKRETYGLPELDKLIDHSLGLWTRFPDVIEAERIKAGVQIDKHVEDTKTALMKLDAEVRKFGMWAQVFGAVGDALGGRFGDALSDLGGMFDGLAAHSAQAADNLENYGSSAMTASQKTVAAAGAMATAISIFKKGSESLNGAASAMSGAVSGAAAGAAFGTPGVIIGAIAGGLLGFFSGSGFRKMAGEAGKTLGVEVSEGLAKAIKNTMKDLKVDVNTAALLNLDKAMQESGRAASSFEKQIGGLFDIVAVGGAVGVAALEQLDSAFQKLVDEGTPAAAAAIRGTLAAAFDTGVLTESMQGFVKDATSMMESGAEKILEGLSMISGPLGEMGTAAAQFFVAGFTAKIAEVGLVEAISSMGSKIEELHAKLLEEGNTIAAAMLAPFVALSAVINDEADPALKGFLLTLQGVGEVFSGLNALGFVTQDAFRGLEVAVGGTVNALSAAGVVGPAAFMAIAPQLAQIIQASNDYGFEIDANTQALIDQARQAGISFPTDPMQKMVDLLGQLVILMGGTLPESMSKIPIAADDAFGKVEASIGRVADRLDELTSHAFNVDVNVTEHTSSSGGGGGKLESFASGSDGFKWFGSGTPVMLHGREAVVTEAQGEGLAGMLSGATQGRDGEIITALQELGAHLREQASAQGSRDRILPILLKDAMMQARA